MAIIISNDKLDGHSVDKYNFKVLAFGANLNEEQEQERYTKENNPGQRESDLQSNEMSQSSKESLIESLMKKTDEMSSNFIKLQMKLEAKEEEYKLELEKVKSEAYAQGLEDGLAQAKEQSNASVTDGLNQFSASVVRLEQSAKEFESSLESIKSDLMLAALDIAKEVVSIELSENSNRVAMKLADELINELQGASKITLKVNPKNHGFISEKVGKLEYIEIVSDSAVSEGGVIAISSAGNIDSQISKRFQKVKKAALGE
jgi:flagellar assembly protein FliH